MTTDAIKSMYRDDPGYRAWVAAWRTPTERQRGVEMEELREHVGHTRACEIMRGDEPDEKHT